MDHELVSVTELPGTHERDGSTCAQVQVVCSCKVDIPPYDRFTPTDQFNNDPEIIIATMGQFAFDNHVKESEQSQIKVKAKTAVHVQLDGSKVKAKLEAVAAAKKEEEDARIAAAAAAAEEKK